MEIIKHNWLKEIANTFNTDNIPILNFINQDQIEKMIDLGFSIGQANDWVSVCYDYVGASRFPKGNWGDFGYSNYYLNFEKKEWNWDSYSCQISDNLNRFFWGWCTEAAGIDVINRMTTKAVQYLTDPLNYKNSEIDIKKSDTKERVGTLSIIRWGPFFPNAYITTDDSELVKYKIDKNFSEAGKIDDKKIGLDVNNWAVECLVEGIPIFQLGLNYSGFNIMKNFNQSLLNNMIEALNLKINFESKEHECAWSEWGKPYFNTKENYLASLAKHSLNPVERFVKFGINKKDALIQRGEEIREHISIYSPMEAEILIKNNIY